MVAYIAMPLLAVVGLVGELPVNPLKQQVAVALVLALKLKTVVAFAQSHLAKVAVGPVQNLLPRNHVAVVILVLYNLFLSLKTVS